MLKKILESLKQKREEKLKDKPMYEISSLRTANIVRLENKTPTNHHSYECEYRIVKDFAIIQHSHYSFAFIHIKSKQELREMFFTHIGDYAVDNIRDFEDYFAKFMRINGLTPKDKLSYNQIVAIENKLNTVSHTDELANKLFN